MTLEGKSLTGIEWSSNEGNVIFHILIGKAGIILNSSKSGDAGEDRVGLFEIIRSAVRMQPAGAVWYLSTPISRQRVVPQAGMRSCNRGLLVLVVS